MDRSDRVTRPLTVADFDQSMRLGLEAFGALPAGSPPPSSDGFPFPGRHWWGTFEGDRLVARMFGRTYGSWYGGVDIATCGIAGVTVMAESRGTGLLHDLFAVVLEEAAARGEVLSTLFATAPGIYRGLGYELIGSYDSVEVPTAGLASAAGLRRPDDISTRRATAADGPAIRKVYDAWASGQNGPLTRRGPSFPASDDDLISAFTGITLAEDSSGHLLGYVSWDRGSGYAASATIKVGDLITLSRDAALALWHVLGTFSSVAGHVRVHTSGLDVSRLVLPFIDWDVVDMQPYLLRVHDVAGALSARPLPGSADVMFSVAGDPLGTMDGGYRLSVDGAGEGQALCARAEVPSGVPAFSPQGLALAYAGAQSSANIRLAGHLTGGTTADDRVFDALFGGRQVHIRDYF